MNLGDLLLAMLDSLQPILDRWPLVLLAIVLVTLLGIPARILVGAVAKLLRVPADYTRQEIDPLLRRSSPTLPGRLLRNLRDYFRPVLDRPARALGGAIDGLFNTAERAPRWNVEAITGAIVGLVSPLVDQAATHAENGSSRIGAQAQSAAAELRGSSNRWAGWRVIGGFLFFIALLLFLYADAALSIASHEKAIGAQVTFLPEWFREITLAYAISSFVGALTLGLVFFDLIGMTHLGPWDDLAPARRNALSRVALALAVCFLLLSLFLATWRASVVVPDFIPADLATKFEGIALVFPVPLMLLATALLLVGLVLRALSRALPPLAVLLGGILRVVGIVGLLLLIGVVALAAAAYFALSVVAVGVVFVVAFVGLLVWAAVWFIAEALVYVLRLIARVGDAVALVLQALIDAVMWPGRVLWNWFASFDRMRAMHIQPIRVPESRPLRLASGEQPPLEEAAR